MTRWTVLVVAGGRVWPTELPPHRPVVLGRGRQATIDLCEGTGPERHATLVVRDDAVQLEVVRATPDVLLNDVPVAVSALIHHGDEVRVGGARLLFERVVTVTPPRPRVTSFDDWCHRLSEALVRSDGTRGVGLVALAPPSFNVAARQALARRVIDDVARAGFVPTWGELSADLLVALLPDAVERLAALVTRVELAAGPRVKVVSAMAPADGADVDALLGTLWARLLGEVDEDEPVISDPMMVRLFGLAESLADASAHVCFVGPPGAGRATLARHLARAAGQTVTEVQGADTDALTKALGASRLVLAQDCGDEAVELVLRSRARALVTTRTVPRGFEVVLQVPPLHARPLDVPAMADAFLARARQVLGRPRLHLGPDALPLLQAWSWPGNVRELKNVMLRAARVAVRDEVSRDSLPTELSALAPRDDLRGAMVAAERDLLLEALARTRWNVTAASARLGMPRRTLVYRMARLGLRRPAR